MHKIVYLMVGMIRFNNPDELQEEEKHPKNMRASLSRVAPYIQERFDKEENDMK